MSDHPGIGGYEPPPLLRGAAGWVWRLLLLGFAGYLLVRLLDILYLLVLPFVGALLASALVYPLVHLLRRAGLGRASSTWLAALLGLVAVLGAGYFVVTQAAAQYPQLVDQLTNAVTQLRDLLARLGVKSSSINNVQQQVLDFLQRNRNTVTQGVLTTVSIVAEAAAGFVLWLFISFFLLYDGDRIWHWLTGLVPGSVRERAHRSGEIAWARLAGYVRGTFLIAVFHGVVVGITLLVMGVPLVAPLALLVFLGSFIPIVGAFVFGGLAVLVTLLTKGLVLAVVLVGVLVLDNQIEAHLLQPFLVGRYVRLHPLAIVVAITGGGLIEGIYGAILAVPVVAVGYGVAHFLATGEDSTGAGPPHAPDIVDETREEEEEAVGS